MATPGGVRRPSRVIVMACAVAALVTIVVMVYSMSASRILLPGSWIPRKSVAPSHANHGPDALHIFFRVFPGGGKPKLWQMSHKETIGTTLVSLALSAAQVPAKVSVTLHVIYDPAFEAAEAAQWEAAIDKAFASGRVQVRHVKAPEHGNRPTNLFQFETAVNLVPDADAADPVIYFVEDDYLHLPGALPELMGFLSHSAYREAFATLYDHPDRYRRSDDRDGGKTTVVADPEHFSHHWRVIESTTMTFACRLSTLRKYRPTLDKHAPDDRPMWYDLGDDDAVLYSPLPALATHLDPCCVAPNVDWDAAVAAERAQMPLPL